MSEIIQHLGITRKLISKLDTPIQYFLPLANALGNTSIHLNPLIGKEIFLKFSGNIFCIHCHTKTKKSFQQGFCFKCAKTLAQCDLCIVRPERCHHHLGTCREPDWAITHCMIPHIIYLANTSGLKVGITRETQIPTRWIDQGATEALPILKVSSRYISGLIEVLLAKNIKDKTDWRKMLKGTVEEVNLFESKEYHLQKIQSEIEAFQKQFYPASIEYFSNDNNKNSNKNNSNNNSNNNNNNITRFTYPVLEYPTKISSINLEKTPEFNGILMGIKGQYLIFDSGVLNIRNISGYEINMYFYL